MSEQLSLLDWKPPAKVLPFPLHRSHGATIAVARSIVALDTSKRTGKLNTIRAQTRKRLQPLIGLEAADQAADDLVRKIRIAFAYCECPTQTSPKGSATVISISSKRQTDRRQYGNAAARTDDAGAA